MSDLYDADIHAWAEQQAQALRHHAAVPAHLAPNEIGPDWPNIIEAIESVGRSERSALASHVRVVLEHLLKLEVSPATAPRGGWRLTVLRARAAIDELLQESPSLRTRLDAVIAAEMLRVRPIVADLLAQHGEAPRLALEQVGFTREQVLGPWLPG